MMLGRHVYRVHPTEQGWMVTKKEKITRAVHSQARGRQSPKPFGWPVRRAAKASADKGDGTIVEE